MPIEVSYEEYFINVILAQRLSDVILLLGKLPGSASRSKFPTFRISSRWQTKKNFYPRSLRNMLRRKM